MTETDVDVAVELARLGLEWGSEPTRVLLVDPAVREPLAEAAVQRRPLPGEAVRFDVDTAGLATYVVEAHGAWQLRVPEPPRVNAGDEVTVHVA